MRDEKERTGSAERCGVGKMAIPFCYLFFGWREEREGEAESVHSRWSGAAEAVGSTRPD